LEKNNMKSEELKEFFQEVIREIVSNSITEGSDADFFTKRALDPETAKKVLKPSGDPATGDFSLGYSGLRDPKQSKAAQVQATSRWEKQQRAAKTASIMNRLNQLKDDPKFWDNFYKGIKHHKSLPKVPTEPGGEFSISAKDLKDLPPEQAKKIYPKGPIPSAGSFKKAPSSSATFAGPKPEQEEKSK